MQEQSATKLYMALCEAKKNYERPIMFLVHPRVYCDLRYEADHCGFVVNVQPHEQGMKVTGVSVYGIRVLVCNDIEDFLLVTDKTESN